MDYFDAEGLMVDLLERSFRLRARGDIFLWRIELGDERQLTWKGLKEGLMWGLYSYILTLFREEENSPGLDGHFSRVI